MAKKKAEPRFKVQWPKDYVWCTGGKHPKPFIPRFDKNGVIVTEIGCSHPRTADCECECHEKPRQEASHGN